MPVNGSSVPQHGSPGHQTYGCDLNEHLDYASGENEDPDAGTNHLLRGHLGDDGDRDGAIYASKEAQGTVSKPRKRATSRSIGSGFKVSLPPLVSSPGLHLVSACSKRLSSTNPSPLMWRFSSR